ncbi:type II secretion system F family protein [Croceicoccus naphthovorans]|uniref:Pilus assembly protein TadB n=1 Tax=Croceicoccus naphthovorans TaxID=1348774 RepID=A0A0G3XGY3_9SPHN|nr:type II secretion system F family protein [Croceicoccus naphthovorans]AKM10795.1 pilus assembly protein TadB [Croceicoccus naphthovorans]MBB3989002.1 tight adherence protein B [Croceicoccus naphthovorans]
MDIAQIGVIALGLFAIMFIAYIALYGSTATRAQTKRLQQIRFRHSENGAAKVEAQFKKAVAARRMRPHRTAGADSRIAALSLRLDRTGKDWTVQQYLYGSVGLGVIVAALVILKFGAPLLGLAVGAMVGAGLPHLVVKRLIAKRTNAFNVKFPDGIELLVRGLRSGLPVTETLGVVAGEVPGPVGEEFQMVVDRVKVGKSLDDALQETADKLDLAEFKFFCISLAIQRETGGNLAETLSNLAKVLRDRAQMKLKIRAMSSEAKASAYIVGALPFVVFIMVYMLNPKYLGGFFTDDRLIVAGLGGMVWMSIGAFIMYKMVSFEI